MMQSQNMPVQAPSGVLAPASSTPGWRTYTDPDFAISIPANWTISATSSIMPPILPGDATGTPFRSIAFSSPTYGDSVLVVAVYPHGFDIVDRSDDAPAHLGGDNRHDFYYYAWNGNVPAGLMVELKRALSTFQVRKSAS